MVSSKTLERLREGVSTAHFSSLPAIVFSIMLTLMGCAAVGPNYSEPRQEIPSTWQGTAVAQQVRTAQVAPENLAVWWQQLNDSRLTEVVEQALHGSLDIRAAQAKLQEARARRALAGAQLLPTMPASASASRSQSSKETGGSSTNNLYSVGFDASWEPDVFGGLRRGEEAAQADLEASEAQLRDAQVSLVAEVALNYVNLRAYQARLAIANANATSQAETLELTRWRVQAGLTTDLDLEQARSNLEQTRAQIPSLDASRAEAEHNLEILTGQPPGTLHTVLSAAVPIPQIPEQVTVGIPADTLRQRPDVRAAERTLAAETARIGVAEADHYPSFTLSGSLGLEALRVGSLTGSGAIAHSLLSSVAAPIFDAGRIRQQIAIQTAVQKQAWVNYESTVLNALKEVENALVTLANAGQRQQHLKNATQAARVAVVLARQRYAAGIIDFQTVLETERTVLTLEDTLKANEAEQVSALIQLYKALGGGWSVEAINTVAGAQRKSM